MDVQALGLRPEKVEVQVLDGNRTRRPVSHFLDLLVDGSSLLRSVRSADGHVTELNRAWLPSVPETVEVLLGRRQHPELAVGRVPLLVCAPDGDLGCGALTTALALDGERVSWSDFRWEDGYREPRDVVELRTAVHFDRRPYEAVLHQARGRVAELPHDEAEHRSRGFLWPWQWGWRLPPRA